MNGPGEYIMSSASSEAQALPEGLDFYRVRDDLARQYNPAGAVELMLVTQIAQAWICLRQAYETQRRYFEANDVLEAISTQFEQYKAVTREVTNCERVWRHALLHLEKMQRSRQRNGLGSSELRRGPRSDADSESPQSSSPDSNPANPPVGAINPSAVTPITEVLPHLGQYPSERRTTFGYPTSHPVETLRFKKRLIHQ
jgi:hypothetical protein